MDITQLILDDHHEQRRLFAMLEQIDRANTDVLSAIWGRLAAFLELHAKAEEEIFYPALLQAGIAARRRAGVEDETLDAIGDHNEIRDAVLEAAKHQAGSDSWYAAVAAANEANGDHMAEEEREGLTDFRRLASLQERHDLAVTLRRLRGAELRRRHTGGRGPGNLRPRGGAGRGAGRGRVAQRRQPQGPLSAGRGKGRRPWGTLVTGHGDPAERVLGEVGEGAGSRPRP